MYVYNVRSSGSGIGVFTAARSRHGPTPDGHGCAQERCFLGAGLTLGCENR